MMKEKQSSRDYEDSINKLRKEQGIKETLQKKKRETSLTPATETKCNTCTTVLISEYEYGERRTLSA